MNDGKGFLFVSHVGNVYVYPSGFLPIHAGNIRQQPLAEIYRNTPIFKALRNADRLEGRCGPASTRRSAADRGRGPLRWRAIRWRRSHAASTSRRNGSRSPTRCRSCVALGVCRDAGDAVGFGDWTLLGHSRFRIAANCRKCGLADFACPIC